MRYIDANKKDYGIEPICQVLEVAPSTYYDRQSRPISARRLNDARLKKEIERVHKENFEVYGMEKMWLQLNKEKIAVGRDQVRRLMREMGLDGVVRGKTTFTTVPGELAQRPADRVNREFKAPAPNRLWVADLSYVWTRAGFVYRNRRIPPRAKRRRPRAGKPDGISEGPTAAALTVRPRPGRESHARHWRDGVSIQW